MTAASTRSALIVALALTGLAACNAHPLTEMTESVTGAMRQTYDVPPRTEVDLLFVVDDSGSMCQEQASLARNFGAMAEFFVDRLGEAADLRIAVTSTSHRLDGGRFLARPAPPGESNCLDPETGERFVYETDECVGLDLEPVLSLAEDGNVGRHCTQDDPDARRACRRADLERRFRCMTTIGAQGDGAEKGLESMRRALSCRGPNAAAFGRCCTEDGLDPACRADDGPDPVFLRPEALLVVVFVSDEDDCSVPADGPAHSDDPICRYGIADADADGLPDGVTDSARCGGASPAECYALLCADTDPEACHALRCAVPETDTAVNCGWHPDRLVPTADYARFLFGLKARPAEQLMVAAIVGGRIYTPDGHPIRFAAGDPLERGAECAAGAPGENSDACCPDGVCLGDTRHACGDTDLGGAATGHRYLELAEQVGAVGVDCVEPNTSICADDLVAPIESLTGCVQTVLSLHCLDKPIADPERARVGLLCPDRPDGLCPGRDAVVVDAADWRISADDRCAGGSAVYLSELPPPGSRIVVDYLVSLDVE